jgi:hypothetical protein
VALSALIAYDSAHNSYVRIPVCPVRKSTSKKCRLHFRQPARTAGTRFHRLKSGASIFIAWSSRNADWNSYQGAGTGCRGEVASFFAGGNVCAVDCAVRIPTSRVGSPLDESDR